MKCMGINMSKGGDCEEEEAGKFSQIWNGYNGVETEHQLSE